MQLTKEAIKALLDLRTVATKLIDTASQTHNFGGVDFSLCSPEGLLTAARKICVAEDAILACLDDEEETL